MDAIYKLAICSVIAGVFAATIRSRNREIGLLVSLSACVLALIAGMPFFRDSLNFIHKLGNDAGLLSSVLSALLKVCAINLLVQICSTFCEDAGEQSLAKAVSICGAAASLCAALPLAEMLLDLLRELTGNL